MSLFIHLIKDSQVAICVYDITNKNSFETLKNWVKEIKLGAPKNISNYNNFFSHF